MRMVFKHTRQRAENHGHSLTLVVLKSIRQRVEGRTGR
jgi:hypothetical protein